MVGAVDVTDGVEGCGTAVFEVDDVGCPVGAGGVAVETAVASNPGQP
jgi:hypothetical protein